MIHSEGIILLVLAIIGLIVAITLVIYAYLNMNYDKTIKANISCRLYRKTGDS